MEDFVEGGLEAANHLVDKHYDKGYDRFILKKKSENAKKQRNHDAKENSHPTAAADEKTPTAVRPSANSGGAAATGLPIVGAAAYTGASSISGSRRRQRNQLPSPERDIDRHYRRDSLSSLQQESETSDRVLREYEREADDPRRKPESVLSRRDLNTLRSSAGHPRRDSAMASGYGDAYTQAPYAETSRPRSQPPKSRYYDDDDDSDYDERSGRRYTKSTGRGYDDRDDRDYDVVREETERYRGPPSNRPWGKESSRVGHEGPYGAGAMTQYGRRSDGALDRQESYVSRRSKDRGRDRDRSPSDSRSRSRSRSSGGGGIKGKLEDTFDTTGRGLGVGLAGAVIGGLAGRQFGQRHKERDIIIGALVGGLGANAAENKWREWKDGKEGKYERDAERWEQRYDGRGGGGYDGRARSNVR